MCNIDSHNTVTTLRVPEDNVYHVVLGVDDKVGDIQGDISIKSSDVVLYAGNISADSVKASHGLLHRGVHGYIVSLNDKERWAAISLTNRIEYVVEVNLRGNLPERCSLWLEYFMAH